MTDIERAAEKVAGEIFGGEPGSLALQAALREFPNAVEAIARALTSHARPAAGFIREATGPDRKVLGTLPVTADGAVCGHGAIIASICRRSHGAGQKRTVWIRQIVNKCEHIAQWYSSVEAAEAAAQAERGEVGDGR